MKSKFSLNAYSCTLFIADAEKNLLDKERKYIIPIYQRPYAWEEKHIQDLFTTIFESFEADDACFLGTLQLIPKSDGIYEVVDGQQRLSTFMLIFKVLELKFPKIKVPLHILSKKWIESHVNGLEQQKLMQYVLNISSIGLIEKEKANTTRNVNRYLANALLILDILEQKGIFDSEKNNAFLEYLLTKVYFVIVETLAGLTKTLEIFKTINTAGMDLNGGDIFKIRMYEYLTDIKKQNSNNAFTSIDTLYATADKYNNILKNKMVSITEALLIYSYILIEKNGANRSLHKLSSDLFYERVFNSILSNKIEKDIDKKKFENSLSVDDIKRLLDMKYLWEIKYGRASNIHNWQHNLLWWWTRYSNYWILNIIYMYQYYDEKNFDVDKFNKFSELSLRFFIIKSIEFAKSVNEVHTYCFHLIGEMVKNKSTPDTILKFLQNKITECAHYRTHYEKIIGGDISDNTKKRGLICWLSAILKEKYTDKNCNIVNKLFTGDLDVEHIEPCNPDVAGEQRQERQKIWEKHLNTIGNLVLLNSTINRSGNFSNKNFPEKYPYYEEYANSSKIEVIKDLVNQNLDKTWTLDKCDKRRMKEVKIISKFLFGE